MTEKRERNRIPWKKFRNGGRETIKYRNLLAGFLFLLLVLGGGTGACASVTEGTAGNSYTGSYVVIVNTSADTSESTGKFSCTATESDTSSAAVSQSSLAAQWTEETAALTGAASGQPTVASDTTTTYQTGDTRNFYTYSGKKTFQCIGIGTYCYIWMESSLASEYETEEKLSAIALEMASVYDGQPYTVLNTMSSGQMSYRDGSGKLSIALEQISGNVSGVYMGSSYEPGITAVHINVPSASDYTAGDMASTDGLLVHEGQHALFEQFAAPGNSNYAWLNEGLSVAAMEYVWGGSDYSSWLSLIADNTSIRNGCSLLYSSYRDDTATDYSMQYLFVRYLVTRIKGEYDLMGFFQTLYGVTAAGKTPAAYLKEVTGAAFDGLIADFYTAVIAVESTGKYGFEGDALAQSVSSSYPLYLGGDESAVTLEPASAIVLQLEDEATFTVPTDGGTDIRYRIIDGQQTAASPAIGSGTEADPWEISSARDLNLIANHTGGYYKLTADINMAGKSYTTPEYFTGTLEGADHTITGLAQPLVGTNQGTIGNVRLVVSITGSASNIQGLVTRVNEGTIEDCVVSGTANLSLSATYTYVGAQYGAIAGQNMVAGTIKNCESSLNLTATSSAVKTRVGGIVGVNSGIIKECCYRGDLSVTLAQTTASSAITIYAGGIAGETNRDYNLGGSITACVNYGTVKVTASKGSWAEGQICGFAAANITSLGVDRYIVNCTGNDDISTALVGTPVTEETDSSDNADTGDSSGTGDNGTGTESGGSTGTGGSGTESSGSTGTGGSSSAAHVHSAGVWKTTQEATVLSAGRQVRTCTGCGAVMETRTIAKRTAAVKLNASSLPLQVKKSTTVLKVAKKDAIDSVASWASSNKKIVTVNAKTGKITAKKTGTAYITVTMRSGATAKCRITVQKKKVTTKTLKVSKAAVTLKKGQKYQISASRTPLTTTDKLTWKSSKKKVAAVSQKGVITAKKKGTATITVKSGKRKVKIKVTVK